MVRFGLLLFLLTRSFFPVLAQIDTLLEDAPASERDLVEDFILQREGTGEFNFNTLFEELELFRENPINLNRATERELREFRLLDEQQVNALIRYRELAGDLVAIYELQAVPGFDLPTIQRILPYVSVKGGLDDFQVALPRMLSHGKNELFVRWSRILEKQKGYRPLEPGQTGSRYQGDPNQLYLRYRHTYSNKLSFGLTAEKDRGEEFFTGSNRQGFDYYSAHFYLRDYNRTLRALAIGDFNISFGQGLLLFSGFSYGKGSATTTIKRSGRTVLPYTSVNEAIFMRGAAATLAFGPHLEFTTFASFRRRDANLFAPDTTDLDQTLESIRSLDVDGLHRTPTEIANKNVIRLFSTGGSLKYRFRQGHVALNTIYDQFDRQLIRDPQPYNKFYFRGRSILNTSLDYAYVYRNFNLFGETALSDNGRVATINGLLIGLDRKVDLALVFRHYPKDYVALNANPFGESSGGRNESGFYTGLEIRPGRRWTLNAYVDIYQHPWLRFQADAPSRGREFRGRITYFEKRRLRIYLEARDEIKEGNAPTNGALLKKLIPYRLFQTRLHIAPRINQAIELRTRIDWGFAGNEVEGNRYGFSLLQDVLFRPIGFPLSFTARFALFDTDGFDIRFYHYENNLLYAFSVPPYYNRGTRFYFNLRYRPVKALTIEVRIAQTYWSNQSTIGTGLEEIEGPVRTQVGAQVKYQFSSKL